MRNQEPVDTVREHVEKHYGFDIFEPRNKEKFFRLLEKEFREQRKKWRKR